MSKTAVAAGTLQAPYEDGGASAPFSIAFNFPYTQKVNEDRVYAGTVTDDPISLGTMATGGAKLVLLKCPSGSCTVKFNGVAGLAVPLAPGGYYLWFNPSVGFVTGLTVSTTGAAVVQVLALG